MVKLQSQVPAGAWWKSFLIPSQTMKKILEVLLPWRQPVLPVMPVMTCCSHQAISHCSFPVGALALRGIQNGEKTGYWPSIVKMHVRGIISMSPNPCIIPYLEKH